MSIWPFKRSCGFTGIRGVSDRREISGDLLFSPQRAPDCRRQLREIASFLPEFCGILALSPFPGDGGKPVAESLRTRRIWESSRPMPVAAPRAETKWIPAQTRRHLRVPREFRPALRLDKTEESRMPPRPRTRGPQTAKPNKHEPRVKTSRQPRSRPGASRIDKKFARLALPTSQVRRESDPPGRGKRKRNWTWPTARSATPVHWPLTLRGVGAFKKR